MAHTEALIAEATDQLASLLILNSALICLPVAQPRHGKEFQI